MNPDVHFNVAKERETIPELEWRVEILHTELQIAELLYLLAHPFELFISEMDI